MAQIGQRIRTRIGSNIESTFAKEQELRTVIEEINEYKRVGKLLQEHADGKVSSLLIEYKEIAKDFHVLDNVTPVSREPDVDGKIILWEGYATPKPDFWSGKAGAVRGPLHRVIQHPDGHRVYCRYNSVLCQWIICNAKDPKTKETIPNRFPMPVYRRAVSENWAEVSGKVVSRTVMNKNGNSETRVYQKNLAPKASNY